MINKILKELDRMMDAQEKEIERDMETELESKVYFETAKLFAYREVEKMIKKCAQEAATSKGTDINSLTQANYNTDDKKSEIRRLVCEILDICLCRMEDENGLIKEARGSDPEFNFRFDGRTSALVIGINMVDKSIFAPVFSQTVYLDGAFENKANTIETLKDVEKNISKLLEMRKVDNLKER